MPYIVDGYNVLKTHFEDALRRYGFQRARTHFLLTLSDSAKRHSGTGIIVVFDSRHSQNSPDDFAPLTVYFAAPTADSWIIEKIREGGKYTVVTDDREIILAAAQSGCSRISTSAFLAEMAIKPEEKGDKGAQVSNSSQDEDESPKVQSIAKEAKLMGLNPDAKVEISYKPRKKNRTKFKS